MVTPRQQARLERNARIIAAWQDCEDTNAVAAMIGISSRQIQRIVAPARPPEVVRKRFAGPPREWAEREMTDGMPANWAAETIGMHYETVAEVARRLPGRDENRREWDRVWHQIRQHERLVDFHHEFMPRARSAQA